MDDYDTVSCPKCGKDQVDMDGLSETGDHKLAGEYWKGLHSLARWGGDFKPKPDGNHYSLEWQGRK